MVYILLADGFEEIEAVTPVDILRRAGLTVVTAGVGGIKVTGSHGISVDADMRIGDVSVSDMDMLVLPGGSAGVAAMRDSAETVALIKSAYCGGKYIAAICAAPALLGSLGLLNGKKAVCYPGMEDMLTGACHTPGQKVVVDGNIITSEAAGSSVEFALKLAGVLCGHEKAAEIAGAICFNG